MARTTWTPARDAYLVKWWGRKADEKVAAYLGVSVTACYVRAGRALHLRRRNQFMSMVTVARFLGTNHHTLASLIQTGELRAARSPIKVGANRHWVMDERALRHFVLHQPWAYQFRRLNPDTRTKGGEACDLWALREEAHELHAADPWLTLREAGVMFGYGPDRLGVLVVQAASVGKVTVRRRRVHEAGDKQRGVIVLRRSEYRAVVEEHEALVPRRRSLGRLNMLAVKRVTEPERLRGWLLLPPPAPRPAGTEHLVEGAAVWCVEPPGDEVRFRDRAGVVRHVVWTFSHKGRREREGLPARLWMAQVEFPRLRGGGVLVHSLPLASLAAGVAS